MLMFNTYIKKVNISKGDNIDYLLVYRLILLFVYSFMYVLRFLLTLLNLFYFKIKTLKMCHLPNIYDSYINKWCSM